MKTPTTFTFEIGNSVVEYVHVMKCGGTSVKIMIMEAAGLDWKNMPSADWDVPANNIRFSNKEMLEFRAKYKPVNFRSPDYRIAVVRDPVERVRSAYTNRVIFHKKMNIPGGWNQYMNMFPNFKNVDLNHHTTTMTKWLGTDSSKYTHIFTTSEIYKISDLLSNISGKNISNIKKQIGGSENKESIVITEEQINKIKNFHADDYKYWWNEKVVPQAFK